MLKQILEDKVIVLTRNRDADPSFTEELTKLGATVVHFPTIKIVAEEDSTDFDNYLKRFEEFQFLIFSSVNAVKYFWKRVKELSLQIDFTNVTVTAVGKATAEECNRFGIKVDIIPEEFSAKGIVESLNKLGVEGKKILIPSSVIARKELKDKLSEAGADVYSTHVYDNVIPSQSEVETELQFVQNNKIDLYIFTSPSTFNNFISLVKPDNLESFFNSSDIAAIGSVTAKAINEKGLNVDIIPDEFTLNSLKEKIVNYYERFNTSN